MLPCRENERVHPAMCTTQPFRYFWFSLERTNPRTLLRSLEQRRRSIFWFGFWLLFWLKGTIREPCYAGAMEASAMKTAVNTANNFHRIVCFFVFWRVNLVSICQRFEKQAYRSAPPPFTPCRFPDMPSSSSEVPNKPKCQGQCSFSPRRNKRTVVRLHIIS